VDETNGIESEFYKAELESLKDFRAKKFDFSTWQYKFLFEYYKETVYNEFYFKLLSEGEYDKEKIDDYFGIYITEEIPDDANVEELYQNAKQERQECLKYCESLTIKDYYLSMVENVDNKIALSKLQIEEINRQIDKNHFKDLENEKERAELYLEALEILKKSYNYLIETEAEYGSWQQVTVAEILDRIVSQVYYYDVLSEDAFLSIYGKTSIYGTYQEYLEQENKEIEELFNTVKALNYSVENDIPTQTAQSVSAKSVFRSAIFSELFLITLFLTVLAAVIVSSEFSSGSSRLLFSKPHSRTKILASKYVALLSYGVMLTLAGILIAFLGTVMVNGIGDIFKPDLVVSGGEIIESSCVKSILCAVLLAQLKIIFLISISFLISALFKKSAIAILVGIITNTVFGIAKSISTLIGGNAFKYTIFPYYNMEIFADNYIEYYSYSYYSINAMIPSYIRSYNISSLYNGWIGFGIYALFIGALISITFFVFSKQEIKN
jgi:ABC-2 type transport system permease protein